MLPVSLLKIALKWYLVGWVQLIRKEKYIFENNYKWKCRKYLDYPKIYYFTDFLRFSQSTMVFLLIKHLTLVQKCSQMLKRNVLGTSILYWINITSNRAHYYIILILSEDFNPQVCNAFSRTWKCFYFPHSLFLSPSGKYWSLCFSLKCIL